MIPKVFHNPEDIQRQVEQFGAWFKKQKKWKTLNEMARDVDISGATLRRYRRGTNIARGFYRHKLYELTGLDCFAPHPVYDAEVPGGVQGRKFPSSSKKEGSPSAAPASASGILDEILDRLVQASVTKAIGPLLSGQPSTPPAVNLQPILDALGGVEKSVNFLVDALVGPPPETTAEATKPVTPQDATGEVSIQPMIVLENLPRVETTPAGIGILRTQIIELTQTLAAYSNLPENGPEREQVRLALLQPVQQLFITLLVFDKQFPSDFTKEAERFLQLLNIPR